MPAAFNRSSALAAAHSAGEKLPQDVTAFPNDRNRFYKAITMEQACLKCHGSSSSMSEAVRRELAAAYPEDKAVGYREGDFRGIISVTVK
jgi:cytochrome c551/c552